MHWWLIIAWVLIVIGLIGAFGWAGGAMSAGLTIILFVYGYIEDQKTRR